MTEMRRYLLTPLLFALFIFGLEGAGQELPNPDSELVPVTQFDTPALEFEFPGLMIGMAEYEEGPTGCTVFYFPNRATAVVDVRGGGPGTRYTDLLRLGYESPFVDAIVLAGGSAYGLEAAAGVSAEILSRRGYSGFWGDVAAVPGAIIFDLQPRRFNTVYPNKKLGRAALRSAREGHFYSGARGAGRFAMQGSYFGEYQYSGQGGALRQLGPTKVAVFTVVNAVGAVVDRQGRVVRCAAPGSEGCGYIEQMLEDRLDALQPGSAPPTQGLGQNTTITLVVTNQKLRYWALKRLAVQVHTSMGRAIQPFHTQSDGDTLFVASTGEVENPHLSGRDLGVLASETAWDAILNSVPMMEEATRGDTILLEKRQVARLQGRYHFGSGVELVVHLRGNQVFVEARGQRTIYGFRPGNRVQVFPTTPLDFYRQGPGSPRLHFDLGPSEEVVGITLNPGHWPVRARRVATHP